MRVYIWNAHWNTLGGGEVYAGKIAEVLDAAGYKVTLLGFGNLNRHGFKSRLGVDFEKIKYIKLSEESDISNYVGIDDIFINGSFGSTFRSPTMKSIYIVHFPSTKSRNYLHTLLNRIKTLEVSSSKGYSTLITGFFDLLIGSGSIKVPRASKVILTRLYGEASVSLTSGKTFQLYHNVPLEFEGEVLIRVEQEGDLNSVLKIESIHSPNMILQSLRSRLSQSTAFISSYSQIWANSIFTQTYIELYWNQESSVIYPPVQSFDSCEAKRDPYQITNVGRFMSPKEGHSKNQHLLIEAFKTLCESSDKPWTLNLIGGVSTRDAYFRKIQELVDKSKLQINLYPNSSQELLQEKLRTSQFYWHATGMNVKASEPEKMEHFGISVVEALNAGAIPIVFDGAGPAEILENFPELRFRTIEGLAKVTQDLATISPAQLQKKQQDLKILSNNFSLRKFEETLLKNIQIFVSR